MKTLPEFVKLPTAWIQAGGLKQFKFSDGKGADHIAALLLYAVIAHHMQPDTGTASITYDQLMEAASLSRPKVASALAVLEAFQLIERTAERSVYQMVGYNPNAGWGALPARGLYQKGVVGGFADFKLRKPIELAAIKLYLLFVERRTPAMNVAMIGYEKIEEYTGVPGRLIKGALSFLTAAQLIHIEHVPSTNHPNRTANGYRLTHLFSRMHMATVGKTDTFAQGLDFVDLS